MRPARNLAIAVATETSWSSTIWINTLLEDDPPEFPRRATGDVIDMAAWLRINRPSG